MSVNNDEYYVAPIEIMETEKRGEIIKNEKDFDEPTQRFITNLKEEQNVTVHGNYSGQGTGLFRVEEIDSEEEIFI
ncbi:21711_t:CDS:2 [Gigaspora margarita]|uniref:21711_t:CDS:1 n=1 Tax=Gigaspora margarita TaxID=4874 RepID=A0ABM8VV93_GIGMA|nr:21711_t:CDS:2 [Gigaspora margarita]